MKLLYCLDCRNIIQPFVKNIPRFCSCEKHAIWWENNNKVVVYCKSMKEKKCYVLGIHNNFLLMDEGQGLYKEQIQNILKNTPDNYLFKRWNSLIVRIIPGLSGDTQFTDKLPESYSKPSAKALAKYHLSEAIKNLKELYKGNTSYTDLTKLQEDVNVLAKEHGFAEYDVGDVRRYVENSIMDEGQTILDYLEWADDQDDLVVGNEINIDKYLKGIQ